MPTDHDPPRPDPDPNDGGNEVDDFARRAGAALRRPAPADGPAAALRERDRIRTRQRIMAGSGVAVLLIGGIVLFTRDDGSSDDDPVVGPSDTEVQVATTVASVTTAAAPSSTAAPTTAPPTTAAPTTTSLLAGSPLDPAMNEWMLDYVGGTAGPATASPSASVGWSPATSPDNADPSCGGVSQHRARRDRRTARRDSSSAAYSQYEPTSCGATFAGDPSVALAIVARLRREPRVRRFVRP